MAAMPLKTVEITLFYSLFYYFDVLSLKVNTILTNKLDYCPFGDDNISYNSFLSTLSPVLLNPISFSHRMKLELLPLQMTKNIPI